ncbi:hypothetical protein N9L28_05770 [Luminiphilus sp.]|nr:hypothetical protein [Luminiphilus sp.]
MAGRNNAMNLTGMLSQMNEAISGFGDAGNQYVDTFRRSMAPKPDMSDSKSLLQYADWARRNGYEEEADKYLALGYKQRAIESEKAYRTGTAQDTEKLRGYNNSVETLKQTIKQYEQTDVRDSDVEPLPNPRLENARLALEKTGGERQLLIQRMNDRGNASDFGDGTEGSKAERLLIAEELAAQKAAVESEKNINDLLIQREKLADLSQESARIPNSMLPPSAWEAYNSAYLAAKNSPTNPESAMRKVNKKFGDAGQDYLKRLGQGDPVSIAAIASAEKQFRSNDPDIAEWLSDPANEKLVEYARKEAASALTASPDYRSASEEEKTIMAADTYRKILTGYSQELDEIVEEVRQDLVDDGAGATKAATVTTEDYVRGYPEGWQPGGPQYQKQYEAAKEADGEDFDSVAFAEAWDAQYYRPDGMRPGTNSSPTSRVMSRGPYAGLN